MGFSKKYIFFHILNVTVQSAMTFTLSSYSSSPPLWSIRLEAMRLANLVDQLERLLNAATVFDSMAAAGREFQSGIVRCQNKFCSSVVLALMCSFICWD